MMVGRIKNMVLDVLYYAKERELALSTCRIGEFVAETVAVVQARIASAGIALVCEFDDALQAREFDVDSDQLRAALVNILDNAVDACRESRDQKAPQISFRAYPDNGNVIFDIEDNGIGMSEAVQSKIFTLFFSSKATQGTGIGLFITRKIVHQHGGEIEVQSRRGEGTLFRIRIPLERSETPSSQQPLDQ